MQVTSSGGILAMLGRRRGHDGAQLDEGNPMVEMASSIVSSEEGEGRLEGF
jgi:hypothetical protein